MTFNTAKTRYNDLEPTREPYLRRARTCSKFTLPSLIPPDGWNGSTDLPEPWNNLGGRGVNNLSSKLLLTLFPPGTACFRNKIDPKARLEVENGMKGDTKAFEAWIASVDSAMAEIEQRFVDFTEADQSRVSLEETFKHLVVAGNTLLHRAKGSIRVYRIDKYVVLRDPSGLLLELVVKECVSKAALPPNVKALLAEGPVAPEGLPSADKQKKAAETVDLYTHVYLEGKLYKVYQEVEGKVIPGSKGSYPKDKCPWLPLRWQKIDGEDYGYGHVANLIGDLSQLDMLSQAIAEGAAAAARVLYMKKPGSVGRTKDLVNAPNGGFVEMDPDSIKALTLEKFADFRTAHERLNEIERSLSFAFLMNTAVQRKGERVTAEEIRYMAQELNDALGGVYTVLSQELQLPFVSLTLHDMSKQKAIPTLPKEIKPVIVTGLEALGRGNDLNKLNLGVQTATQTIGPEGTLRALNADELLRRIFVSLGVDTKGLVKTPEEMAAIAQQEQAAAMMQQVAPQAVQQMGGMAKQKMQNESQEKLANDKAARDQASAG